MDTHFAGPKGSAQDWRAALLAVPPNGAAVLSPAPATPAARRIARALLQEAAVLGGGQVLPLTGGDLLVVATAAPGQRAASHIADLLGTTPETWLLPEQHALAVARCGSAAEGMAVPLPSLAELESRCTALPIEEFARLTLLAEGANPRPFAQRLSAAPLGLPDPELEGMARELLCRRLLSALTSPVQRGLLPSLRPGLRLILDLPVSLLGQGAPMQVGAADDPNGPVALLPLASIADPAGFVTTLTGLRKAGWRVGLIATHPVALDWVEAHGLFWAVPAGPEAPRMRPKGLIVIGQPVPDWCRSAEAAPGVIWHEGVAA